MHYPPPPQNEIERLKALQQHYILDTLQEDEFDKLTQLIALICDTPISLISLVDEKRQWFKSRVGLDVVQTPRDLAFCQHTILDTVMMQVQDATMDDRFKDNDLVTGNPNIRFYAGFPLIDQQGFALGSLCVIDRQPKKLSPMQEKALQLIAEQATDLIVHRREKEELMNFKKLFDLSDDVLCIAGLDGYFKSINPAFSKLLGYDEKYLLETPFLQLIHPEDIKATDNQKFMLNEGESSLNFINRYKTSSGGYKVIEWTTVPEKKLPFLYAIGRDITKQKEQEFELRRTQEMLAQTNEVARVGGWEYNVVLNTIYWSEETKIIHEVEANFLPDLSSAINFYKEGESRQKVADALSEAMTTGEKWELELQIITAKGNELWVRAQGHAEMREGKCVRLYGSFQDINEMKNRAVKLEKSALTIKLQNDRLLNFAHIVSHNLRSHTGNIIGLLSMIDEVQDTEHKSYLLKQLEMVAQTLNETIEHLTDVVKLQTNTSLTKTPVVFQQSFNAAINSLSTKIEKESAEVVANFDAFAGVDHVPAYMDSIMLNFISNGIKYKHPNRRPVITVTSCQKNGVKQLTFLDNGIGIDLARHGEKIFGMYKTFHNHPDARGIGLFITKNQIEAAGGSIEVDSTPNVGTSFTITF